MGGKSTSAESMVDELGEGVMVRIKQFNSVISISFVQP